MKHDYYFFFFFRKLIKEIYYSLYISIYFFNGFFNGWNFSLRLLSIPLEDKNNWRVKYLVFKSDTYLIFKIKFFYAFNVLSNTFIRGFFSSM